ncbi:MAG: hypothetical protein KA190_09925 [Kofleriaceae bacterium]|nr:hypothetical protein [Kofleriaceae bacterium]
MRTPLATAIAVTLAGLAPDLARAQPGTTPVVLASPEVDLPPARTRSPGTALALSLGGTAAAYAMVAWGTAAPGSAAGQTLGWVGAGSALIAPSLGQWYAGEGFTTGLGLRLGGASMGAVGAIGLMRCAERSGDVVPSCPGSMLLLVGASGLVLTGVIHDIATAPRAARRFNTRAAERRRASVQAVPALVSAGGARAPGLGLAGTF